MNAMKSSTSQLLLMALLAMMASVTQAGNNWAPLGQSFCREEGFGSSMALMELGANSYMMAVGSPSFTGTRQNQGMVQTFLLNNEQCLWNPWLSDLVGAQSEDQLGSAVSLSCEASFMAVAGDFGQFRKGFVNVYRRSGNGWAQVGQTIRDTTRWADVDVGFGRTVEISCDGQILKVTSNVGVYMYSFPAPGSTEWTQTFYAEVLPAGNRFVQSSLAHNANFLAINEISTTTSIYEWMQEDGAWVITNRNITTPSIPDKIVLNTNGGRIAISRNGATVVYNLAPAEITQVGENTMPFEGDMEFSRDGETVLNRDGFGMDAYRVASIPNVGGTPGVDPSFVLQWRQVGDRIIGPQSGDFVDASISLDGSIVALSDPDDLQAYFLPADESFENKPWFDCLPNMDLQAAKECEPLAAPEPGPTEIVGSLEIESSNDGGRKLGAVFAVFGFILACCFCMMWVASIKDKLMPAHDEDEEEKKEVAPTMKDIDEEMQPLNEAEEDVGEDEVEADVEDSKEPEAEEVDEKKEEGENEPGKAV